MSVEREHLDQYYTPDPLALACVGALLGTSIDFQQMQHFVAVEPSVGRGAFARALKQLRPTWHVVGVDLELQREHLQACDQTFQMNWLDFRADHSIDIITGNPPFSQAQDHIEHALAQHPYGLGFLLRLAFLEGRKRHAFWKTFPASDVHVLVRRPSFVRADGQGGGTDNAAYGFFVWKSRERFEPVLLHTPTLLHHLDW